jgi:fibronectin type 3 domain-containing protein
MLLIGKRTIKGDNMKNKIAIIIAAVSALLILQPCQAQEPEFGVAALSGPDGIQLLIGGDVLNKNTAMQTNGWVGYNIYKKDEGQTKFKKLNDKLIARVNSLTELEKKLGRELDLLQGIAKAGNHKEFWDMIESRDEKILVFAMMNPPLREALGLSYLDKDVKSGNSYIYAITRVDTKGKESAYSDTSKATFGKAPFDLMGPQNVKGKASDNSVRLQWQVNPDDSAAFSYSIYRATKPEGPFERLNERPVMIFYIDDSEELPSGAFIDTTAKNGRLYYYSVVSVDMAGNESPKRPLLSFSPKDDKPPIIPQKVAAKSAVNGIAVTWEIIPESDLAGFIIYRSMIPDSLFTRLNEALCPPDSGYWLDKSALPNTQYYYQIAAVDYSGNLSEKSATSFTLFENRRPPLIPNPISAEGTPEGIMIKWRPNAESDLRGYYVFRADRISDTAVQVSPLISKDTTFYHDKDSRLSSKGSYRYMITAVNYTGVSSGFSFPVIAAPAKVFLPEPPLSFYGYQDVIGNRLFWTPTSDNFTAGYLIYRAIESDSLTWAKLTTVPLPKNANNYTDSSAAISVTYLYKIKSVDGNGNEGNPSHSISLSKFAPPALPPSNIIVTKINGGLAITWDTTMEPRVKGYHVYRRVGKGRTLRLNNEIIQKSTGEYRDLNVSQDLRYFYSVSSIGEDGREGSRSNEVDYLVK